MKNRPTDPGTWWYRDSWQCVETVRVDCDMGIDDGEYWSVISFEKNFVDEWLGKAVPPKRVERLDYNEDPYGFDLGRDLEPSDNGPFVRYQDVKEYLVE